MQISIDNVMPDAVSKKSLKVLDKKLQMLADHAEFHVNINSVVGGGIANPDDARVVSERALGLGFSSTIGIIHDGSGQLKPLGDAERKVWDKVRSMTRRSYSRFNHFQEAIANGKTNDWRCRAGGRYLYVCENGLVHYCSQQRGFPGVPLANYTTADVKREFLTREGLRPQLHDQLRASGQLYRPLACSAEGHCDSKFAAWNRLSRNWYRFSSKASRRRDGRTSFCRCLCADGCVSQHHLPVRRCRASSTPSTDSRPTSRPYSGDLSIFEYPDRDKKLQIDRVMDLLGIKAGKNVADIGAGSGWFTVRASKRVGPTGAVLAEDINPLAIESIGKRATKEDLPNVRTVLGRPDDLDASSGKRGCRASAEGLSRDCAPGGVHEEARTCAASRREDRDHRQERRWLQSWPESRDRRERDERSRVPPQLDLRLYQGRWSGLLHDL